MSRLFQPSGLPILKFRNLKSESQHVSSTNQVGSSSVPLISASKIAQLRPSTVAVRLRESNEYVDKNIPLRPSTAKTKIIHSKINVKVTKTTGEEKMFNKIDTSIFPEGSNAPTKAGSSLAVRKSAAMPNLPPSSLRKEVSLQMKSMLSKAPIGAKVTGVGAKSSKVAPLEEIMTSHGPQQVLQKVITEKRVERTKYGEVVAKNIRTIETDPATGENILVEEEFQELNPEFPPSKGLIKETVSILSERDITTSFVMSRKNIIRETIKLTLDLGMDKNRVELLVREETEDVSNILKNVAPELVNQDPRLFSLKKRHQQLSLSPENAGLLEKSFTSSPITADLPTVEASPELVATVMDVSNKSGLSTIPTERIFNSLFGAERESSPYVILSSASPGPLEDVVIPTFVDENIHQQILSRQMEQVSALVQLTDNKPSEDSFLKAQPSKPRRKGRRKRPYKPLSAEDPPWSNEALLVSIEAVGARPSYSLHPPDILDTVSMGRLKKETAKGVEYILDCEPHQYLSRVQLRGSQPPPWFPGYMVALSNSVEVAKSPSEVLLSAWKSVQPDVFSDDSVMYN